MPIHTIGAAMRKLLHIALVFTKILPLINPKMLDGEDGIYPQNQMRFLTLR